MLSVLRILVILLIVVASDASLAQGNVTEEIIVSTVGGKSIDEIISSTDIVEHEGLDRNINSNIGQILENLPGISSASFGRAVGRPVIRGLGDYRVQVLENDLGGGDVAATGPDHPHAQNALAIQKLEILKGPSALRFGPFAATGVVNILSEHKLLTPETESGGDLLYGYSTVADENAFHFHTLLRNGNWFMGLSGHSRDGANYKIPGFSESALFQKAEKDGEHTRISGMTQGTDLNEQGLNLHSTYLGSNLKATLFYNVNESLFGVPGDLHHEEELVRLDMKRDRLGFELNHGLRGPFDNVTFSVAGTDYRHKEIEGGKAGTQFENDSLNIRIELIHSLVAGQVGLVGFSRYEESFLIEGTEKYLPSADSDHEAIFAVQNFETERMLWEVAARLDRTEIDPEGSMPTYSNTASSFSLGGGYRISSGGLIGLSIAKNTRSPSMAELYAKGPHIGPQVFEMGSFSSGASGLKEEESISTEVYFRYSDDRWHLHSSVFNNQFDDFVYGDFTGQKKEGLLEIQHKQSDAIIKGAEIELEYLADPIGVFDVSHEFSLSAIEGKLSGHGHIPRIPPLTYQYVLDAVSENWSWLVRLKHASSQADTGENELPTDSYNRVDFEISWIPANGAGLTFSLLARNLGDKEIRNHTSYLKDRLPEPGRNINLTVQYGF